LIRAASTLGLLGHELRLTWRGWFGRRADGKLRGIPQLIITAIFLVVVAWFGVMLGLYLRRIDLAVDARVSVIGLAAVAALFTLMLSQTLIAAVNVFYDRGDLDLLLSSPVAPIKILAVRAVSMSISAIMIFALILAPVLVPVAVLGHPAWLAAYAVLAAISLTATGLGLALALLLMSAIGPRRTKTAAQLLAAAIGAAFFIASQIQNILGEERAGGFWMRIFQGVGDGRIDLPPYASWPARAALGEPVPLLAVVLTGVGVFAASVVLVGRRFAADAAAAKGAASPGRARAPAGVGAFRVGAFSSLLSKELRLLWRDPAMLSQVLLRVLYIPPLVFLVLRNAGGDGVANPALAGAAAGLVFMAGQVAASLSWITISGEEAPELLAMSPAPAGTIWRAKLAAALIPISLIMIVPLVALAWFAPLTAAVSALGCAASAVSAGLVNIWLQKPGKRNDFRRRKGSSLEATLAELVVAFMWGMAVFLAVSGYWLIALVPCVIALGLLAVCRRSEEMILSRIAEAAK
jgi:ABC-2 type transport system permease protein